MLIIGAGFTGLSAAYELAKRGVCSTVLESDAVVGGLAGSFDVEGVALEKFYHHWFMSDQHVIDLVKELGAADDVVYRTSRTGMYYANTVFRLSRPTDVLRFTPLRLLDRFRLGWMVLQAQRVKEWRSLEHETAAEWITRHAGAEVYRVVWGPLMRAKFGEHADEISAVWFWNKLKLRGGSRGKDGSEMLAYFRGGFAALADRMVEAITRAGGAVRTSCGVQSLIVENGAVTGVMTPQGAFRAERVLLTVPLPVAADLIEPHAEDAYVAKLRQVQHLGNICLVLQLDRSLSNTYWLNVTDPTFPYVAIIEHTNFEPPSTYHGRHIVYLSRYLSHRNEAWSWSDDEIFERSMPHMRRMFPALQRDWIVQYNVWRTKYSQPVVVRRYSELLPTTDTPIHGLYLATMAQVYPEDRGTNYAIRDGRRIGERIASLVGGGPTARETTVVGAA